MRKHHDQKRDDDQNECAKLDAEMKKETKDRRGRFEDVVVTTLDEVIIFE